MFELTATVRNRDGIHCRPSALIARAASDYPGTVAAEGERGRADLSSMMEILSLALLPGSTVTVRVEGPDEEAKCREFVEMLETPFNLRAREEGQRGLDLRVPPKKRLDKGFILSHNRWHENNNQY